MCMDTCMCVSAFAAANKCTFKYDFFFLKSVVVLVSFPDPAYNNVVILMVVKSV